MSISGAPIRLGVFDGGRALPPALTRGLDGAGWQYRLMGSAVPPEDLVPMRLDALVIDLAVLGPQAWSYLEQICLHVPQLGVIVCTGQSTVAQRVRALRLGVDDWLSKPCHPAELIARVEAVMRRRSRGSREAPTEPLSSGEIEILPGHFQATVADAALELTRREFGLLELLASAQGRVLAREEIYERVWGYAMVHGDRSVDVYVRKLRQKLETASPGWRYIHTHFGVGYRFAPTAHVDGAATAAAPARPMDEPVGVS